MTDGVSITFEFRLKPEAAEGFLASAQEVIKGTADFPGFRSIRVVQHRDDPTRILFIERWDSEQAYADYIAWRTETGAMAGFAQITLSMQGDVWPRVVAEATSAERVGETEGVSITFALTLKPEMVGPFTSVGEIGPAKTFPGFRSIRMVQHKDDPTRVLFIERWDTEAAYKAYVDWQIGQGGIEGIRQITTGMDTNIWPTLVACA
jgi:quinol monooxygenase YgiN